MNTTSVKPLVRVSGLDFSYPASVTEGRKWCLRADTVTIEPKSFYSLRGPNMVGKSTLLKLVEGRELPDLMAGVIDGERVVTVLVLHDDPMFPELSLWDNVRLARPKISRLSNKDAHEQLAKFIDSVDVFKESNVTSKTLLNDLSSGGRALMRLARASAWNAQLLLIDEVTAHLDPDNARLFLKQLALYIQKQVNSAAVLVSHQSSDHEMAKTIAEDMNISYHKLTLSIDNGTTWVHED